MFVTVCYTSSVQIKFIIISNIIITSPGRAWNVYYQTAVIATEQFETSKCLDMWAELHRCQGML